MTIEPFKPAATLPRILAIGTLSAADRQRLFNANAPARGDKDGKDESPETYRVVHVRTVNAGRTRDTRPLSLPVCVLERLSGHDSMGIEQWERCDKLPTELVLALAFGMGFEAYKLAGAL